MSHDEKRREQVLEKKLEQGTITESEKNELAGLKEKSEERNESLLLACQSGMSQACISEKKQAIEAGKTYDLVADYQTFYDALKDHPDEKKQFDALIDDYSKAVNGLMNQGYSFEQALSKVNSDSVMAAKYQKAMNDMPSWAKAWMEVENVASIVYGAKYANEGLNQTIYQGIKNGSIFDINKGAYHLSKADGFSQRRGISGGHNSDSFYRAASDNGVKILSETPTGINGITHITYQIPTKDRTGKFDGNYKQDVFEKTVYDPKIFSDTKILELGQRAAANGYSNAVASGKREYTATAGGVKFQVYLDPKTGTVTNFFPVGK
ncbi:CdiA family toxin C-terminal domain-containing protein [Providencia rettgeri]|uniref:CdiA family toxin C-terminal domain-containing protein n=1 Tax=unclassified Providencia TaxID=2633465 RepID=UPI00300DCDF1